jgi:rhodanese-related sulfurtransferase
MARVASLALAGCALLATVVPVAATHSMGPMPVSRLVAAESLKDRLAARERITLIDLRPTEDYEVSRLPRARSIPLSELRTRYTEIPRTGQIVLYCACHLGEGRHAYELLQVRGYRNVVELVGGFSRWVELGYPLEREQAVEGVVRSSHRRAGR